MLKEMQYLRHITIGAIVLIVFGILFAIYEQRIHTTAPVATDTATTTPLEALAPLPPVDEAELQRQLGAILDSGKESDCANLGDPRYQFACHDLFKNMKK